MENEIWWFDHDGRWFVAHGEQVESFDTRGAAFQRAREHAQLDSPSVLYNDLPPGWTQQSETGSRARVGATSPGLKQLAPTFTSTSASWESLAGPEALGRSILVPIGGRAPDPWGDCASLVIDAGALCDPKVLARVRSAFFERARVVYEVDPSLSRPDDASSHEATWRTANDHDFLAESIWYLVDRNAVDARDPSAPTWSWSSMAISLGARPSDSVAADVLLPDGRSAWCDGGPLTLFGGELEDVVLPASSLEIGLLRAADVDSSRADLADDQLAAIGDATVRSRVIAPAGSGKTRVLTERARHLVRSGIPTESLLLVAFNKRAQVEIKDRTLDLPGLQIQTLNALALSTVNGTNGFAPRGSRRTTINEIEVRRLLSSMLSFPRRANTDPQASWVDALSAVRLGLRDPVKVEAEFNGDAEGFAEFFARYRAELDRLGQVDFDEQIHLALEVLLAEPEVRRHAQRRATVLLVDEFQDLTPAHMLLLRLLAGPELGVFGVGDDDQTIYGYSGADPEWLVNFDHYIPCAAHHALTVNYRCPVPVVDAARNLLSHNSYRVVKEIHPGPTGITIASSMRVVHDASPFGAAIKEVRRLLDDGAAPREIAVLSRVNTLLAPVQAGLVELGIDLVNADGVRFVERTGVAAALSWLRIAVEPQSLRSQDILRAARRPSRGISPRVVEWMSEQHDVDGLTRLAQRVTDDRAADKIVGFVRDVERISAMAGSSPADRILEFVRSEIGLDRSMQTLDAAHRGRNSAAHSDDLRALIALGELHPDATTLLSWLADVLGPRDVGAGVTLATVHKVKGLEWPHVVVLDATQGIFPHKLSTDIEEERRIFHVAMTRCQQSLTIVADEVAPSMFLDELNAAAAPSSPAVQQSGSTLREVAACVGLALVWGGYQCKVVSTDAAGALVEVNASKMTITFGSQVSVDGVAVILVAPSAKTSKASPVDVTGDEAGLFQSLKAWRLQRSHADKVPPYVVAHDSTLAAIATLRPTSEADLLGVPGMGPKRVEYYGDEILAVIEDS